MKKKYETPVRYDIYNNKLNEGEYYSPARRGYQYKFTDATGKTKNLTSPSLQGLGIKEKMIVNGIYKLWNQIILFSCNMRLTGV